MSFDANFLIAHMHRISVMIATSKLAEISLASSVISTPALIGANHREATGILNVVSVL